MTNDKGEQKIGNKCGFFVLFDEITTIRGAIDGLQGGVNEARNRSMETKQVVGNFFDNAQRMMEYNQIRKIK